MTVRPITQGLGNVLDAFSRINPAEVVSAIVTPITDIPVTDMWCKAIGIGCGPDRHAAFKTETFESLRRPHSFEQISIGTDFFDCLDDLRILRQQEVATSHLMTLAGKVMQFEHLLAAPEDLRNNLDALAETWKDVLFHTNIARVRGTNGVGKIIKEFPRLQDRSSSLTTANISSAFSPAHDDLATAASFILTSAQAVKKAEELAKLVHGQAHSEIDRLHTIQNNEESGLGYLVYGWTEPCWKYLQPGWVGRKQQREEAARFLGEVIKLIDESVIPMLRNAMSLQQCAIDIEYFNHEMERDFSLEEPSESLSMSDQLTKLASRIESLQSKHGELKKKDEAARRALAGAPPPSLPPVEPRPSLEGAGAEQGKAIEHTPPALPAVVEQGFPV